MKKAILTFVFTGLLSCALLAQVPQAFKYQAVVRDKTGQILSNQNVNLRISILQSAVDGPEVYSETHTLITSELGLVNIEIGSGKDSRGTFSSVNWGSGSHFLKLEMDTEGGSNFELMGVSQLLSVPYALYAEEAGSGMREADLDWQVIGNDVVTGHGGSYPIGNVGIGNNTPGSLLYVAKNTGEPTITIRNLGGGGGAAYSMIDDLGGANWKFKATTYGGFKIRDQSNTMDVLTMEPNSAANTLYIKTGGNVGIGKNTPAEKLDVSGRVRSDQGFNVNGTNGLNDTTNQITDFDFINSKLKYRTTICSGGIITYRSEESGWVTEVGDPILPYVCGQIGLVGEFNSWGSYPDHLMTRDNVDPNKWSTIIKLTSGDDSGPPVPDDTIQMKFRENQDWSVNWGSGEFPGGTAVFNGPNIPVPLNGSSDTTTYSVTFNCETGAYFFQEQQGDCAGILTDSRDGKSYMTVLIGTQCWMAENLNIGMKIDNTTGGFKQTDNGIIEKYCYNNDTNYCNQYGGLYEWPEAMQYVTTEGAQGICPAGWYIATDDEWKELEGTVDSQYPVGDLVWDLTGYRGLDAGGNVKESGLNHWLSPNAGATNSSGFTGLPGGYRCSTSYCGSVGMGGYFFTSSQYNSFNAWYRSLSYVNASINRNAASKEFGNSIRCLRDCVAVPTQSNAGPDQLNLSGTSTTLAGNTPASGIGVWRIITGTGGIVSDTLNSASGFQGLAGNSYSLTWTISTLCGNSADTVEISFAGSFTCGSILTDSRDGQSYTTVLIGTQCWMAQNMNVGVQVDSWASGYQQADNGTIEKYCFYNDTTYCDAYGGLYEWPEAMQYLTTEGTQGICTPGWHVPTDNEFTVLADYLGGYSIAGGKMKETGYTHWMSPNTGATNESGFTAIPGGNRAHHDGYFYNLKTYGFLWSSTWFSSTEAWYRDLGYDFAYLDRYYNNKGIGYSIRCLKDD